MDFYSRFTKLLVLLVPLLQKSLTALPTTEEKLWKSLRSNAQNVLMDFTCLIISVVKEQLSNNVLLMMFALTNVLFARHFIIFLLIKLHAYRYQQVSLIVWSTAARPFVDSAKKAFICTIINVSKYRSL